MKNPFKKIIEFVKQNQRAITWSVILIVSFANLLAVGYFLSGKIIRDSNTDSINYQKHLDTLSSDIPLRDDIPNEDIAPPPPDEVPDTVLKKLIYNHSKITKQTLKR